MTNEGTLIGKIIADITGIVVRDVLQELRPDILFADEMPEFLSELKVLEPSSIKDTIINAIRES